MSSSALDYKKIEPIILNGPNWAVWYEKIRGAARIVNCWDVMKGENNVDANGDIIPNSFDLLPMPHGTAGQAGYIADADKLREAIENWKKKNSQALSLLQLYTTSTIWATIKDKARSDKAFTALETKYSKAGGAQTFLQLINVVHMSITDSKDLIPQIQTFQDNYDKINSNGFSKLSEDLAVYLLTSALPKRYETTAHHYIDNINDPTKLLLVDLIARVTEKEARQKAQNLNQHQVASSSRISTTKSYYQKCDTCGKTNHTTTNHWPDGKRPTSGANKAKGKGKKKFPKGKGKEKAQKASVNSIRVTNLPDVSINSMESITVSCYIECDLSSWMMDGGCSQHITNYIEDYISSTAFPTPGTP